MRPIFFYWRREHNICICVFPLPRPINPGRKKERKRQKPHIKRLSRESWEEQRERFQRETISNQKQFFFWLTHGSSPRRRWHCRWHWGKERWINRWYGYRLGTFSFRDLLITFPTDISIVPVHVPGEEEDRTRRDETRRIVHYLRNVSFLFILPSLSLFVAWRERGLSLPRPFHLHLYLMKKEERERETNARRIEKSWPTRARASNSQPSGQHFYRHIVTLRRGKKSIKKK